LVDSVSSHFNKKGWESVVLNLFWETEGNPETCKSGYEVLPSKIRKVVDSDEEVLFLTQLCSLCAVSWGLGVEGGREG